MLISICVLLFLAQVYGVIASLASGVDAGDEQGIVSVAAVAHFGQRVLGAVVLGADGERSATDAHFGSAQ